MENARLSLHYSRGLLRTGQTSPVAHSVHLIRRHLSLADLIVKTRIGVEVGSRSQVPRRGLVKHYVAAHASLFGSEVITLITHLFNPVLDVDRGSYRFGPIGRSGSERKAELDEEFDFGSDEDAEGCNRMKRPEPSDQGGDEAKKEKRPKHGEMW